MLETRLCYKFPARVHQQFTTARAPIVKVATFGLIIQKTVQILHLFLMMSDGGRHDFPDLVA